MPLTKSQRIRDFTARRHHAGRHRIELPINGLRVAETSFSVRVIVTGFAPYSSPAPR
jgi:hypothetical protein